MRTQTYIGGIILLLALCVGCSGEKSGPASPLAPTAIGTAESNPQNKDGFKAELSLDVQSYQDQLKTNDLPVLEVLEQNLTALVDHDHTLFRSGFVNNQLADAMEVYYSDQYQYKFTAIESIEQNLQIKNQVHITVLGERYDTHTDITEEVKMMYAIRRSDQGVWTIYTID
ncbi:hypothetical protein [Paenibacillus tengchongensis]|uniref:hypothetical protein n=1 Tax=Paenibacillus tengchongensis TaxID=2608684 RepID=UPI00124CCE53|nr:hypothetical protein [Paenibacillus tengchongensis]